MKRRKTIITLFAILLVAWISTPFVVQGTYGSAKTAGEFGDLFGSINALFSALALLSVVYAIFLQMDELKLQREELETSRKELSNQTKIISAQLETMNQALHFERTIEFQKAEPFFRANGGGSNTDYHHVHILNDGASVADVRFVVPDCVEVSREISYWDAGAKQKLSYPRNSEDDITVEIVYTNKVSGERRRRFTVPNGKCALNEIGC